MPKKLRVLISAYACEPNKGSEPEVGWQWALQMARFHDVTVLTRANNRAVIELELAKLRGSRPVPQFVYHEAGPILLGLKQRFKLVRLYYMLWQRSAWKVVRRLNSEQKFDLLHHLTFAAFRYGTAIWKHGVPTVWGPVGGAESIPFRLLPWKHPASLFPEMFRNFNNVIQTAPFHRMPGRAAATSLTLVTTYEMAAAFKRLGLETTLMATIGLEVAKAPDPPRRPANEPLKILYVGNIITLKGIDMAIQALGQSGTNATFTLVGDGNFLAACKRLVERLGLEQRVHFRGRLPRPEVLKMYGDFDLLMFPSLHDTGGYAVIEAMACGLPVICLDCGGPRVAVQDGAGIRVPLGSRQSVIAGLAEAIGRYDKDRTLLARHGAVARQIVADHYDWDKKGEELNKIYEQAVEKGQTH